GLKAAATPAPRRSARQLAAAAPINRTCEDARTIPRLKFLLPGRLRPELKSARPLRPGRDGSPFPRRWRKRLRQFPQATTCPLPRSCHQRLCQWLLASGNGTPRQTAGKSDADLLPPVVVLQPHDVVLADVIAGLHLDHHAVDGAGIREAMRRADLDVGRLVRPQKSLLLGIDDLRRAGDHDPVLAAVVVQLKRKARARLHDDALDLEARPFLQ